MRFACCVLLAACAACAACDSGAPAPAAAPARLANVAPAPAPHVLVARLERKACYGWCPVYTLSIYRDGAVEYHGEHFVKVKGAATVQLPAAAVAEVERAFAAADYFSLADHYTHESETDAPTAITSFHDGGRTKQIEHYYGDDSAPEALVTLEGAVDRIVGAQRWLGTPAERKASAADWR